ncbi:MAG: pilus (MSHA type) biogenesis protein MshL [Ectothiorhodospiraceae bacterium]|nr:pilus (MSHA type) biogenesis protein MshL [Chromatiales bacterium]MCP5155031.1 pilus (MSHA type) biogenesis protein MshL [Ectothiorhodospiraceae bacterium]
MNVPLRRWTGLATAALALVTLSGCQSSAPRDDSVRVEVDRALRDALASQAAPATAPPPAVESALVPPLATAPAAAPSARALPPEPTFTIKVKDAPAPQFFMGLVEGTRLNMVVHPDVGGQLTLDLKDVTIADVMEVVRNVYGYEYRSTRVGYEVLPQRLRSRIYQVNFLNMRRVGASQTRVSSGQVTDTGARSSSTDDGTTTTDSQRQGRVTGTEINTLQPETSFWQELASSIDAILGGAPGRSVVVNPQSGVVVVRAMPNELREVEEYLTTTQAIAQRQVILEAKILEVKLNDRFRQGINWAGLVGVGSGSITAGQVGGATILEQGGASAIRGNTGDLNPAALAPIVGTAAGAFGGMFTLALALNDFTAFIELLDTQGDVHVLSSPRIATLNNQKAVIKVGSDEFFVTDVSNTTVTGTTTTTTPSVELTPFFSGIALDVTPQISAAGDILLHVHPAISEVRDQQKAITIGAVTQTLPLAFSTVRESDSIVRARSGQVVVIGGLMQTSARNGTSDAPLAGAPVVGNLFRHRNDEVERTELVILLKPVVVDGPQQWVSAIEDSATRIEHIHRAASQPGRYGQARP